MASCWELFAEGSSCKLLGCVVWFTVQLAATCLVMRRLVRRENASSDLDLAGACQHALAEVDVCVAPEPHGLGEGGSNVRVMVVTCTVVGLVAVGCSWARFTQRLYSQAKFFRFLDHLALQRIHYRVAAAPLCTCLPPSNHRPVTLSEHTPLYAWHTMICP